MKRGDTFERHQERAAGLHQPANPGKVVPTMRPLGQQSGTRQPVHVTGFFVSDFVGIAAPGLDRLYDACRAANDEGLNVNNTNKQFDYVITKGRPGDTPFFPHVELTLAGHDTNTDGTPRLSAHLMSAAEIDFRIQALKDDLDVVGRRAKTALAKAQPPR